MKTQPTGPGQAGAAATAPALLLNYAGAAALLSLSERLVRQLVATGELRSVLIRSRRLVPRSEVEAYVARLVAETERSESAWQRKVRRPRLVG